MTTRALARQSIGPTEAGDARGLQRADELRDGAQAEDGQVAVPAAIDAPCVFLDEHHEAVVV